MDQSMEFLDWVDGLGFEKTWLGSWAQKLDARFGLRRLLLFFLFSLGLSFLLYVDFDFSYSLKPGDVAQHDIKSPLSFEVIDDVATEEKRLRAENNIPPVFDYDRSVFESTYDHTYRAFRHLRDEVRRVKWSKDEFVFDDQVRDFFKFKGAFDTWLGRSLSDREFEWLVSQKFSSKVENGVIGILDYWSHDKIIDGFDKHIPLDQGELLVREVSRSGHGREFAVDMGDVKDLSREEDFAVRDASLTKSFSANDKAMLMEVARSLLLPNITINKADTKARKQRARDEVLPEVIVVKKNQVIISEGSIVKPIHATLLREIENQKSYRHRNFTAFVSALLFVVLLLLCFSYLRRFTLNRVQASPKDIAIMGLVLMISVTLSKMFLFLTNTALATRYGSMIPDQAILFAAPVASGAMLVGLLISAGELVWIFSLVLSIVVGFMLEDAKFAFFLVTMAGCIAAARGVFGCKKRNDIYMAGLRTGAVNALMIMLVITVNYFSEPQFAKLLLWSVPAGFLSGLLSSLVAMMLVPLLETLFNCTTDVKLLELSNLNHPLLKEMIVRAPGTYHHSLVVGSMVEAAAEEIGANPLLAKVMSYYHDIGKCEHATYFIENQKASTNPHDTLSPHMSKTILIAHVKDGVELGVEYKLGKPIIDGIVQHHGTTLIQFFYNRALEGQDESLSPISEDDFRYPGPKPQFREAALCMLADSIEAASRSLDEPTPVRLQNIVKNIIQRKFMDGQLEECNLTLRDLSVIEDAFIRILLGIYHQRIDYPRRAGGGTSDTPTQPSARPPLKINSRKGPATA
jgi:putative nucleotidyltransferase with HDIG domain